MDEPIRVAQIIGKMVNGGVEAVVMNYYRHIDRSKVQFDFIVDADSTVSPPAEIEELGGRVYIVPPYQHIWSYIRALIQLFRQNRYRIVHAHLNTLSVFPLFAAKCAGAPVRIAHSHSTAARGETARNIMKYALRPFSKVFATHYAACSRYAGEWLFGKRAMEEGRVTIFNNAIELDKFSYDADVRSGVRRELGVEGRFVIGHVGRFCYQKNQSFLIDVFEEVYRRNPDAVLMFTGDGADRAIIEEKASKLARRGSVIFMGNRDDVARLYQAMDMFVLPSRYEGLGMSAIEAQACGVPAILSSAVPEEAIIRASTKVLELSAGASAWADEIMKAQPTDRAPYRGEAYDIRVQARKLTAYYGGLADAQTSSRL